MATMRYGDYIATIDYEDESELFHGRVVNIRDVVNFYGGSVEELQAEFRDSIQTYLEVCEEEGIEPSRPYSGRFNVRMPAKLHQAIAEASAIEGKSLNRWVVQELTAALESSRDRGTSISKAGQKRTRKAQSQKQPRA